MAINHMVAFEINNRSSSNCTPVERDEISPLRLRLSLLSGCYAEHSTMSSLNNSTQTPTNINVRSCSLLLIPPLLLSLL
jgi:hypothetical protein